MDKQLKWIYVNSKNHKMKITLNDIESSIAMEELLKATGADWVLEDALVEPTGKIIPPPFKNSVSAIPYIGSDHRQHQRFQVEFQVVIISGTKSFRNTTHDISLGGIRLTKGLPLGFSNTACTIFISHPERWEKIELHCLVIQDSRDLRRIQFSDVKPHQIRRLETWLMSGNLKKAA